MKNVGMENTAQLLWNWANEHLRERDLGRTCCWKVEARENDSNEATYSLVPNWFIPTNLED
jgi:6-pyruvoyltetrahydropterin/6-carboxytetrahydropterin synthase